ncbi:MAG: LysR family transcriptional regulator, low CO2-responsive transcriptional regulator [Solirubrobacteraceae bacterium]|nr:LysR family transcriptional regulator, low CO2-responsive transcriptional regulator [Solirubrobacteraceae bacterium]
MSVTLTQLRSFLAVMRTGSVTSAADELVVTQPSVSAAITALSHELGTPLLERSGRGVRPTAAGRAFAPFATDVIGLLEKGRQAAGEAAASSERVLRIAAVTTAAESFVPALMRAFSLRHPDVRLGLSVGNRSRVIDLLLSHKADVAFGGRPPGDQRIRARPFRPNELVLISAPDDPLAGTDAIGPTELNGRTWLLREPESGTRSANEDFLAAFDLDAETLTVGSNGAIREAARLGLGISFLSRDAVESDLHAGRLSEISVRPGPAAREWHVMSSSVGPARPLVEAFVQFVTAA